MHPQNAQHVFNQALLQFSDQHSALARKGVTPTRIYVGKWYWQQITEAALESDITPYENVKELRDNEFMGCKVYLVADDDTHFHVSA